MSAISNIPEKPFFRVNEVCRLTDTQPYVLRFWESEFPQLTPDHGSGAAPVYKKHDIELIFRIKQLLYDEEYTIAGARQILSGESPASRKKAKKVKSVESTEDSSEPRLPRQLELDAAVGEPPSAVSKQRYDDAVEEITHLRLQLSDLENRLRRSDHDRETAQADTERFRDRSDRAIGRLEAILTRLQEA